MQRINNDGETQKLGFVILENFPMACLTSFIEPLRAANEISRKDYFQWNVVGESLAPVRSSSGVEFKPDIALEDTSEFDEIFILSAPNSNLEDSKNLFAKIRKFHLHGMNVGAISGGVFILARSGVLNQHAASVHWCYAEAFQREFENVETIDDVIYSHKKLTTISGAAAGFEYMLSKIATTIDETIMTEVACWFQHPMVRSEGVLQRIPSGTTNAASDMLPEQIRKAVELFSADFEQPISVNEVADIVGLSRRHFERKFQKTMGVTPMKYYRAQRMKAARQMVLYSAKSLTEIAATIGYTSSNKFNSYYKEHYGEYPKEARAKVNMFRLSNASPIPSAS